MPTLGMEVKIWPYCFSNMVIFSLLVVERTNLHSSLMITWTGVSPRGRCATCNMRSIQASWHFHTTIEQNATSSPTSFAQNSLTIARAKRFRALWKTTDTTLDQLIEL